MGSAGEPDPEGASSERRAPTCAHSQSPRRHTRPSACAPRPAPGPAATLPHTESFIFRLEKERRWREDQRIIVGLLGNKKKKHCNVRRKRNMKPCPSPDILLHCLFFSTFPSPKPRLKASGLGFFFFNFLEKNQTSLDGPFFRFLPEASNQTKFAPLCIWKSKQEKRNVLSCSIKASSRNPTTGPISHSLPNHLRVCHTDLPAENGQRVSAFQYDQPRKGSVATFYRSTALSA